jgi:hypothetical protein
VGHPFSQYPYCEIRTYGFYFSLLGSQEKFAIRDQKIVWYGSINYLSYGDAEESIMRIESAHIANELLKSIEDKQKGL